MPLKLRVRKLGVHRRPGDGPSPVICDRAAQGDGAGGGHWDIRGAGETDPCKATLEILPHLLPHITIALTILAASHGRFLVRVALSPGQGWYQWVLIGGVTSFFALLIWLWYRTITAFLQSRRQRVGEKNTLP